MCKCSICDSTLQEVEFNRNYEGHSTLSSSSYSPTVEVCGTCLDVINMTAAIPDDEAGSVMLVDEDWDQHD